MNDAKVTIDKPPPPNLPPDPQPLLQKVLGQANQIILGKQHEIKLALSCLLAKGHLLIEDQPGVGKTTLAQVLAHILGLQYNRIQFTSDLLPADIIGVSIFERETGYFQFKQGPIFAQLILADEVNRATPKAQSALLEAMEEQQVTSDGDTRPLPQPFFVIATQNPSTQIGTFPLPESQLDRFMLRISLGYPDEKAERALLSGSDRRQMIKTLVPCLPVDHLLAFQKAVHTVHVAEALLDYLQKLLQTTRRSAQFMHGLSPRAGLAFLHCAKAWAYLDNRSHVLPDDIKAVLPYIVGHRLKPAANNSDQNIASLIHTLNEVAIP